ncbi:non-classical export protein [Rutstroemia sp. NJR-2017a WRK4]|nr:non-classical export protein [Rutstroemia sp. NJR-2017a WRK4]
MVSMSQLAMRTLQFVFVLIATALVGNAIDIQHWGNSSVNYAMFACAFSWVVILYGAAASFIEALAIPIVVIVMDALATLITLLAGIILAGYLNVHSCSSRGYLNSNHLTQGSEHRCRDLQAATAFLWFSFAAFLGSLILDVMSGRSGMSSRGSRRGPAMSQV